MSNIDISGVRILRGQAQSQVITGNRSEGRAEIDNLCADPQDSVSCSSKVEVCWNPETQFRLLWNKSNHEIRVSDQDSVPDLRLKIQRDGSNSEIAILNGTGDKSSEIRFPIGKFNITEEAARELESLQGSAIHVRHSEDRQSLVFHVGHAPYPRNAYAMKDGGEVVAYQARWVK